MHAAEVGFNIYSIAAAPGLGSDDIKFCAVNGREREGENKQETAVDILHHPLQRDGEWWWNGTATGHLRTWSVDGLCYAKLWAAVFRSTNLVCTANINTAFLCPLHAVLHVLLMCLVTGRGGISEGLVIVAARGGWK